MPTISTIGTCRIFQPANSVARLSNGKLVLNNRRLYGFTHASKEAVQAAAYMLGHIALEEDAWPLLSEKPYSCKVDDQLPLGDFFLVEISSLKQLRFRGAWVKLNLLNKYVRSPTLGKIIWRHPEADDLEKRERALEKSSDYHLLSPFAKQVARELIVTTASVSDIAEDLTALRAMLGTFLVVTHCNASGADGEIIPDRARCVETVETAARSAGLRVYNPSGLLSKFGQRWAMTTLGLDTAHYTPEFDNAIAHDLSEQLMEMYPSALAHVFHEKKADEPAKKENPISRDFASSVRRMQAEANYEKAVQILEFCSLAFPNDPLIVRELERTLRSADIGANSVLFKRLLAAREMTASEAILYLRDAVLDGELARFLAGKLPTAQPREIEVGIEMLVTRGFAREAGQALRAMAAQRIERPARSVDRVARDLLSGMEHKIASCDLDDAVELFALASSIGCHAKHLKHAPSALDKALIAIKKDSAWTNDDLDDAANLHPQCLALRIAIGVRILRHDGIDSAARPVVAFLNGDPSRIDEVEGLARHAVSADIFLTAALLSFSLAHLPERRQAAQALLMQAFRSALKNMNVAIQERRPDAVESARAVLVFEPRNRRALAAIKAYCLEQGQYQEAYDVMRKIASLHDGADDRRHDHEDDASATFAESVA